MEDFNAFYDSKEEKLSFTDGYTIRGITDVTSIRIKADGGTTDGYHTFDELYHHRAVLFSIICRQNSHRAWKSKLHHDGTMYENYFIVGITTPEGDYTYHYNMDYWNIFDVPEIEKAPMWDGHKPEDITRLYSLL